MTMSNQTPQLYEVWRLAFAFEDRPEITKERPVVIGAIDRGFAAVLAVKVTGHGPRPEYPGEVTIIDWKAAGLDKPSVARHSKTLVVPVAAFDHMRCYGTLSDVDALAVAQALREIGMTQ